MAVQQTFEFLAPPAVAEVPVIKAPIAKAPATGASVTKAPVTKLSATQLSAKPQAVKAEPAPANHAATKQAPLPKQEQLLKQLRGRVHGITTASKYREKKETFSTGSEAIDQWLPGSGLRIDAVNEWVADVDACGASALSLAVAATRQKTGSLVVVADNNHFYPPAAAAVGIDPSKLIWVRPTTTADSVWAIDQALRCTGVSAVWAFVGGWLDDRDARRFQLAAETGRTAGFLVRPRSVRGRPTFAEVRFHVAISKQASETETHATDSSLPTWTLTLDRCQGSHVGTSTGTGTGTGTGIGTEISTGRQIEVTMDHSGQLRSPERHSLHSQMHRPQNTSASRVLSHESAAVRLASQLAHPKTTSLSELVQQFDKDRNLLREMDPQGELPETAAANHPHSEAMFIKLNAQGIQNMPAEALEGETPQERMQSMLSHTRGVEQALDAELARSQQATNDEYVATSGL